MFDLNISAAEAHDMGVNIEHELWKLKSNVQLAMGIAFESVVLNNFGFLGEDRPDEWPPLSPAYAKKVNRTWATLQVDGTLRAAVKLDNSDLDFAKVSASNSDVPYATAHQHGVAERNLPARPYFPMDPQGEVTDYTKGVVREAAINALREELA